MKALIVYILFGFAIPSEIDMAKCDCGDLKEPASHHENIYENRKVVLNSFNCFEKCWESNRMRKEDIFYYLGEPEVQVLDKKIEAYVFWTTSELALQVVFKKKDLQSLQIKNVANKK